jgi:hypothetical protein
MFFDGLARLVGGGFNIRPRWPGKGKLALRNLGGRSMMAGGLNTLARVGRR